MCGINGFLSSRISENLVLRKIESMNESLAHRGPDDSGVYVTQGWGFHLALGQRRLSIIDLSPAGHQPMHYRKDTGASSEKFHADNWVPECTIVFNGEIYNFREIRNELTEKGYIFATESDTEVILSSYKQWWIECVEKFNGMWSFFLYDHRDNTFWCSRDRFGKKPFYYYMTDTDFVFSSELKGIITHTEFSISHKENISQEALDFYFSMGNIPAPYTIYKNVNKLQAWHNLVGKIENGNIKISTSQYYQIPPYAPSYNKDCLIDEWRRLLEDAVKIRMFSADVPVGAFLSWWLDSSSVVAKMTQFTEKKKLHTFSIGFEWIYDETEYINIVKQAFWTNHHHAYFREEDFEKLSPEIAFFYDEPFADESSFPSVFVSDMARKHVTVALSGDGGDEVFGWYLMHQVASQMEWIYPLPKWIKKLSYWIAPHRQVKKAFYVALFQKEEFYIRLLEAEGIYVPEKYKKWIKKHMRWLLKINQWNFTQSIIDFDLLYNTLWENFLTKVDRASMSQSLEVRSPFLDYRFIEFSRHIPVKWKVRPTKTKILMRQMIDGLVPETILNRSKKWFTPPISDWLGAEKYQQQIRSSIEYLHEQWCIDEKWYEFFSKINGQYIDTIYRPYFIRIFFLSQWYKRWIF